MIKHLTGFWTTFCNTLKGCILNRDTFAVIIGGVAFYLVFYAWPYSNQQIEHIPVGIVDLDGSQASRLMIQAMDGSPTIKILFTDSDEARALDTFKREHIDVIVTIPRDYERNLAQGKNTTVHLLANGAYPVKGRAVQSALTSIIQDSALQLNEAAVMYAGLPSEILDRQMTLATPSLAVAYRYNNISGYANYTVPVVGPVIIQAVMLMGITMALGAWIGMHRRYDWVRDAMQAPWYGGLAIFCAFWLIGFLWCLYMQGFDFWWHQYGAMTNPWGVILWSAIYSATISAFAMAITAIMGSNSYTTQAVVMISAPAVFMSGAIWPVENIGNGAVWVFSQFLPSTPGIRSSLALAQDGAPLSAVLLLFAQMLLLTLFYFSIAAYVMRRRRFDRISRPFSLQD